MGGFYFCSHTLPSSNLIRRFVSSYISWRSMGGVWLDAAMHGFIRRWRVLRGFCVTYNIDRRTINWTNIYLLGSIVGVLLLPVALLFSTGSVDYFIFSLGLTSFIYWICILFHALYREWPHLYHDIAKFLMKLIFLSVTTIVIGMTVRELLAGESKLYSLLIGVGCQAFTITVLMFLMHRNEVNRCITTMKSKY